MGPKLFPCLQITKNYNPHFRSNHWQLKSPPMLAQVTLYLRGFGNWWLNHLDLPYATLPFFLPLHCIEEVFTFSRFNACKTLIAWSPHVFLLLLFFFWAPANSSFLGFEMANDAVLRSCLLFVGAVVLLVGIYTFSFKKMIATYIFGLFAIAGLVLPDWEFFDRDFSQWFTPMPAHSANSAPKSQSTRSKYYLFLSLFRLSFSMFHRISILHLSRLMLFIINSAGNGREIESIGQSYRSSDWQRISYVVCLHVLRSWISDGCRVYAVWWKFEVCNLWILGGINSIEMNTWLISYDNLSLWFNLSSQVPGFNQICLPVVVLGLGWILGMLAFGVCGGNWQGLAF